MLAHTVLQTIAQTEVLEPNWTPLLIVLGVIALIALLLLIPPKKAKALEDSDKKSREGDSKSVDGKEQLSLTEIKESKRVSVSEAKTKEELRELRKERRAATQTEKAIQGREDAKDASLEAEAGTENAEEVKAEANTDGMVLAVDSSKSSEEDLLSSLFGDDGRTDSLLTFNDFEDKSSHVDDATSFPMLGSALIPLSELTKAADSDTGLDPLAELTKRFSVEPEAEEKKNASVSEPSASEAETVRGLSPVATEKQPQAEKKPERSLNEGLSATRSQGFLAQIGRIFRGELKSSVVEELEEILFTADIGVQTSERLLARVTENLKDKGDGAAAMLLLRDEVQSILSACEKPFEVGDSHPHVILTIGVNGAGKTTTLGKLASQLTSQGKKVLLIAGDTFRAAAVEQLEEWGQRCGCEVYRKSQGSDPSGTIFAGIEYARKNGFDVALADTAGRLQNKKELIDELKKIHRVCGKALEGAPHEILLVLDATNGQNALMQAREFGEAIEFTGIALTKLDGTAKGGVIIGICEEFKKPVYFIGIGEMIEDLRRFDAQEFVDALFVEAH